MQVCANSVHGTVVCASVEIEDVAVFNAGSEVPKIVSTCGEGFSCVLLGPNDAVSACVKGCALAALTLVHDVSTCAMLNPVNGTFSFVDSCALCKT